jgi:hypothetical protein
MSWWASYRVRSWVTVSSPTNISDRNPRFSKFVMDCKNDDEAIFIEQAGHAGPPCSGSRPPLARPLSSDKIIGDSTLVLLAGNVQRTIRSWKSHNILEVALKMRCPSIFNALRLSPALYGHWARARVRLLIPWATRSGSPSCAFRRRSEGGERARISLTVFYQNDGYCETTVGRGAVWNKLPANNLA